MATQDLAKVDWDKAEWGNFQSNIDLIQRSDALARTRSVLEIGTGKGKLLEMLQRQGHHAVGIDVDIDALRAGLETHGAIPVVLASGDNLPFPDGAFDLVLSFDVFEHIADTDRHLREVRRVMAPGGICLLQTPNKYSNMLFETIRHSRKFGIRRAFDFLNDHCSLHSYWELKNRLRSHGFSLEFVDIPVVNDFFRRKVEMFLGRPGLGLLKVVNPDHFPLPLRTNFFVIARADAGSVANPVGSARA